MKIKKIFFFIILFVLLHFEDRIHLGSISLSNIWKTLVIFIFLFYSLDKIFRTNSFNSLPKIILVLAVSLLLGPGKFNFMEFQEVVTLLILPISYYTFYYSHRKNKVKLNNSLLFLSCFLILSALPFIFGFLVSLKTDIIEADLYGLKEGVLVGLFKHPSLSSKVFVFSTLFIYVYLSELKSRKNKRIKLFLNSIILIGLYCIYLSFTRTGWVMILFGIIYSTLYNKNFKTYFTKVIPALIVLSVSLFYLYNSNETIQRRVTGDRIGRENSSIDFVTLITSGRNVLILNAIETVNEGGWPSIVFGIGKEIALKKNNNTLAHNRFIEIYQYGGLISLFLFLFYLLLLYKEFSKRKTKSVYYKLSLIFFLLLIASLIPSHGLPLWADVLFGGVIALNRIEYENNQF